MNLTTPAGPAFDAPLGSSEQRITTQAIIQPSPFQHVWPIAVIVVSGIITAAWIGLHGYGPSQIATALFSRY